jgi:dTMP kinase
MDRPLLIALLGVDGSGKTTQMRRLRGHLLDKGYKVEFATVGTRCRQEAHRIAWARGYEDGFQLFDNSTLAVCGALEYLQTLQIMVRERDFPHCILFDKYVDSFRAVAATRGMTDFGQVDAVFEHYPGLDLKLYLRMELPESLARVWGREGGYYANEKPDHQARYKVYLDRFVTEGGDAVVIDGSRSKEAVHESIVAEVDRVIAQRGMAPGRRSVA